MARIHFIVNPQRPSIGLRWPLEENRIASVTKDFRVHITRGRLHAEILARQAVEEGCELLVSVGGDSTLSEIANGLYRSSLGGHPTPLLTLHPELHAGDAAKSIPLRKSFVDFLKSYLSGEASTEAIDLVEIHYTGNYGQRVRRVFLNCAGFGFSSLLINLLSQDYRYARTRWNFMRMIARRVPFYKHPTISMKVDGSEVLHQTAVLTGLIHNGRYGAHGIDLSSPSSPFDGVLESSVIMKTFGYRYILGIFPLFAGLLPRTSFVRRFSGKEFEILPGDQFQQKVRVDFDGDCWGYLPARMKILPQALRLVR
jgi:diacylglycerol kinase family enzyme